MASVTVRSGSLVAAFGNSPLLDGFDLIDARSNPALDNILAAQAFPVTRIIDGGPRSDRIVGTLGPDVIDGGDGSDVILGRGGNDVINGGRGNDFIDGGGGVNTLAGGEGADTFRFLGATGDRVTDYSQAQGDVIRLVPHESYSFRATSDGFGIYNSHGDLVADLLGVTSRAQITLATDHLF
ncbi:MAG: calcium-binding protein [Solirubrobacterales bacterium]